jgi:Ca2+-binding RTX toxin-like protein
MAKDGKTSAKITATTDQDASAFDTIGPVIDPLPGPGFFLQGTAGNDYITGTFLDDMIIGLAGNDHLYGEAGNDVLDGGLGNDYLLGGRGADALLGGAGIDTASYVTSASGVTADLLQRGWRGDAEGDTYSGIENLIGSRFDDYLFGNDGNNRIEGGAGDDTLLGGAGADWLIGGAGTDYLYGDGGAFDAPDVFVVSREGGGVYDRIVDFQVGLDSILLLGFDGSAFGNDQHLAYGNLLDGGAHPNAQYLDTSDKLYYDTVTRILYAVDVQMAGGRPQIVSQQKIVEIDLPPHGFPPQAGDFLFA